MLSIFSASAPYSLSPEAPAFLARRCTTAVVPVSVAVPPRILITGSQGFLGARLGAYFAQNNLAFAASSQQPPLNACATICLCTRAMDITQQDSVDNAIESFCPNIVYHCAAVSDTGQAQREPELSYAVNVQGTLHLARACRAANAKLVVMSSDQVYNGTHLPNNPPLSETAPLAPENVYGCHKREAEQRGLEVLPQAVFLRLTWMYDTLDTPFRQNSNVLCALAAAAHSGVAARFGTLEYRGITDVWQVVQALPAAAQLAGGVYNFGSESSLTAYDTACAIAVRMGLPKTVVQADEARFAPAGRNLAMNTAKVQAAGIAFSDTLAGIAAAINACGA